jgi:uncharacterized protein with HEPN domain
MNKNLLYIFTALEAIAKIEIYTNSFETALAFYESFEQLHFNAVLKLLEVIGEDTAKIETTILDKYPDIAWRAIKDMRNRIVHDYRGVDIDIVFSVVKEELPVIKTAFIEIFSALKSSIDKTDMSEILSSKYYKHLNYLSKL